MFRSGVGWLEDAGRGFAIIGVLLSGAQVLVSMVTLICAGVARSLALDADAKALTYAVLDREISGSTEG
ncbi:hypothetical protein [Salipiger mangrovisoli]|uniref:hypothetical protein n=1 Tax=Salipiger mangrovisoli TaxID=2865933 RepID=UPI001F11C855|nr:hypothetical protein [Salipiger mangrovisoli]